MNYAATTHNTATPFRNQVMRPQRKQSTTGVVISGFLLATVCGFATTAVTSSTVPIPQIRIADKQISNTNNDVKKKSGRFSDALDGPAPWVADLTWIREHSDVSVSVLADLFGVTRKAFYSWLEGTATPRGDRSAKIAALKAALEALNTKELRSAIFDAIDRPTSHGTIRGTLNLAMPVEGDMSGLLENVIRELAPTLADTVERLGRKTPRSRHIDTDFAST